MSDVDLSVIVPVVNERENLETLLPRLGRVLDRLGCRTEIVVVDGGSTDGTEEFARSCGARVIRQSAPGFGEAVRSGFASARGEYFLTLDADLSHDPDFVPKLWRARHQAEFLIASRYVRGGVAYMPAYRKWLSRLLNRLFAWGLALPIRDLSSGFRLYHARALRGLELESRHFEILEEVLVKGYAAGWRVAEVPFTYYPREHGTSHARLVLFGRHLAKAFFRLWRLRNSIDSADYDERAFYSRIPPQRYWQRRRHRIITTLARDGGRVLDVGCGSSVILQSLNDAVGLDIQIAKLRHMRLSGATLIQGSVTALPFGEATFDCVICSEVIEHVPADPRIFHELTRVLRGGGLLILGTPDYSTISWRVIEPLYGVLVPGGYKHEHITHYTRRGLRATAAAMGLAVVGEHYVGSAELILALRKPDGVQPAERARYQSTTSGPTNT